MHVTLSYDQYDVTRMCAFNNAVSLASLPQIDLETFVAAKQFTNVDELEKYFLHNANYLFKGASE